MFCAGATVAASSAMLGAVLPGAALAQDFPARPITFVIPWTPGGSTDAVLRQLGASASRHLGQPVVMLNRPGAGGTLGPSQMAATAQPDGYTLSQVATSLLRLPHLQPTNYDPRTDFSYIIGVAAWSTGVTVRADAPWKSWKDLVAAAKAAPGKITYSSSGIGSSAHVFMEQIAQAADIKLLHVPFKGTSDASTALLGGQVDLQADALGSLIPMVDAGRMRVLVNWGGKRHPRLPDVPTLREVGVDIVAAPPYGIAGPKGMAPAVVKRLHDAFRAAMREPDYLAVAERYMFEEAYLSGPDLEKWAREEYERQGEALKKFGLKS